MFDPSYFADPTPLAHADASRDVLPREGTGEYFPPLQFTCRNCGGGDRGRVAIYRPFGEVSLSLNRTVTCMVLKANDRRTSCPCHDEFRGPRSDYVRQLQRLWYDHPQRIIGDLIDSMSCRISACIAARDGFITN
ncbi:uncharacterized protein TNCV_1604451 [Trichonephila clavipes]|nr:uncharacterized protein TNCV_1604451 [Trichonephila clavipes]